MVFLKIEMQAKARIHPEQLSTKEVHLRKAVILRLLSDIARKKSSEEHGYYLAVNTLESMDEGEVNDLTGEVIFPVTFTCTTMKPYQGEILIGTVDKVMKHGLILKSGPIENIFLSEKMMKGYKYDSKEEDQRDVIKKVRFRLEGPEFVNEKLKLKMASGGRVKFKVLGSKWIEWNREFQVLATLEDGDVFGPI